MHKAYTVSLLTLLAQLSLMFLMILLFLLLLLALVDIVVPAGTARTTTGISLVLPDVCGASYFSGTFPHSNRMAVFLFSSIGGLL